MLEHTGAIELTVQPTRWGFCLFSLNMPMGALKYFPDLRPKRGGFLFDSLIEAIGEQNLAGGASLFGIHDYITVFRASPLQTKEAERHSVIQQVAEWSAAVAMLKERENREKMEAAAHTFQTSYPGQLGLTSEESEWLNKELPTFCGGRTLKVPTLYNYTHDMIIPLHPANLWETMRGISPMTDGKVRAFCFLRVDPRVARIFGRRDEPTSSSAQAYEEIRRRLAELESHTLFVEGIWAGLGASNLLVLFACDSFCEIMSSVANLRDSIGISHPGRDYAFALVSTSSTLIVPPGADSLAEDLVDGVRFYVLVRVLSGFHGSLVHKTIAALGELIGVSRLSSVRRQGLFDIVIAIPPGTLYTSVSRLLSILDAFCPFVEDVATIVCTECETTGFDPLPSLGVIS